MYRLAAVKFLPARLLIVVSTVLAGTADDDTLVIDRDDERLELCDDMAVLDVVRDVMIVTGNS